MDRVGVDGDVEVFLARVPERGAAFVTLYRVPAPPADRLAAVLAALRDHVAFAHPHLEHVVDVERVGIHLIVVAETVDGRSLHEILDGLRARGTRMPTALAAYTLVQACRGVHHLHRRRGEDGAPLDLVHGDLGPHAIVVGVRGDVVVRGGALAAVRRALRANVPDAHVPYQPPEALPTVPPTAAGDVYGLGTVLFEALSGASLAEELARADGARDALPAAGQLNPALPPALQAVVHQAMAVDVDARFASARALGEELRWAALAGQDDAQLADALGVWVRTQLADELAAARARLTDTLTRVAAAEAAEVAELAEARVRQARRGRMMGMVLIGGLAAMAAAGVAVSWMAIEHAPPAVDVATTGAIEVSVHPAAAIYLDGRAQGQGEQVRLPDVLPGAYTLGLEAKGHVPWSRQVVVTRGGVTRVQATLDVQEEIPPVTLAFESRPLGADVLLDGRFVGRTPTRVVLDTSPASMVVTFKRVGFANETRTVSGLKPGARRSVSVVMAPPGAR
ncbi:MAG: PEGA domain-containing protein [Alphaproteobacteria bacterium]|nr:PEGA domain-containing protein [Alphaproteobacteria bacterium]